MDNRRKILKRIDTLEALARSVVEEATYLREELGVVQPLTPRKGRYAASSAKVIGNMQKTLFKKKLK